MYLFYVALIITIAIVLRFVNLDGVVYWGDEVYSSLRIFGYTTAQVVASIAHGRIVTASVLQQFQSFSPQLGLDATIRSLIQEDSHLTPLYFILAHLWATIFDGSVATIRGFSVFCSILLLPSLYWLAMELFNHRRVAWSVVLVVVVSPIHLIFAQEARMYELWLLFSVLTQASLLYALRRKTWQSWALFTVITICNLYTHLLGVILLIGNAIYILITYSRDRPVLKRFSLSAGSACMTLLPWLYFFATRKIVKTDDGEDAPNSLISAIKNLTSLSRRIFVDFNLFSEADRVSAILNMIISIGCIALIVIALRNLYLKLPQSTWLFVGLMIFTTPIGLIHLIWRGMLPARYLLPSFVGIQLALGYLLGTRLDIARSPQFRWFWRSLMVCLISLGLLSSSLIVRSEVWWNKAFSQCNPAAARMINQRSNPLVITDGTGAPFFDHALSNVISLSLLVKPTTQFQVLLEHNLPDLPKSDVPKSDVPKSSPEDRFLFTPSENLRQWFEQHYPGKLEPLLNLQSPYRGSRICLWHLKEID